MLHPERLPCSRENHLIYNWISKISRIHFVFVFYFSHWVVIRKPFVTGLQKFIKIFKKAYQTNLQTRLAGDGKSVNSLDTKINAMSPSTDSHTSFNSPKVIRMLYRYWSWRMLQRYWTRDTAMINRLSAATIRTAKCKTRNCERGAKSKNQFWFTKKKARNRHPKMHFLADILQKRLDFLEI